MIGAQAAYACITTESTSLDVRLEAGRSAQKSLREFAEEQTQRALRLMRQAQLANEAAEILEKQDEVVA
jgi:hypothetical protein